MKRVWYFVGICGILAAILNLGPSMAHAATSGQEMSLPSASSAQALCIGHQEKTASSGDIKITVWYTPGPTRACVGSVTETVHYRSLACKTWHMRIYHQFSGRDQLLRTFSYNRCGVAGRNYTHSYPVHTTFPEITHVCAGATTTRGYACVNLP